VDDGDRTHDNKNHNLALYQLSYAHHNMARPAGFEPATLGLEGRCSIQMSYGRSKLKIFLLLEQDNILPLLPSTSWLIFQNRQHYKGRIYIPY
jgi:hypothetical protein